MRNIDRENVLRSNEKVLEETTRKINTTREINKILEDEILNA